MIPFEAPLCGRYGGYVPFLVVDDKPACAVEVAADYLRRARGMLARRRLPDALLLFPGGSVHGVGMAAVLDVAMLVPVDALHRDRPAGGRWVGRYRVAKVTQLRPFGLVGSSRGVRAVLEAPAGNFATWGLTEASIVEIHPTRPRP